MRTRSEIITRPRVDHAHRHDGFFLRLMVGPAAGVVSVTGLGDSSDVALGGAGWSASLDIGGSRGDNLAIFGRLRGAWIIDPAVRVDDSDIGNIEDAVVSQGMAGAGIAYFLMPLNMYLGAAVGFSAIASHYERRGRDEIELNGDVGVVVDLEIGKEWWIADDWGLGLAIRMSLADVEGDESLSDDAYLVSGFIAALLSATYQ